MIKRYPTKYTDHHGSEETFIESNGVSLRMEIRGVLFEGQDFELLVSDNDPPPERLHGFTFYRDTLSSCRLDTVIPVLLVHQNEVIPGDLLVRVTLGSQGEQPPFGSSDLRITLKYLDHVYSASNSDFYFEDQLLEIQNKLPEGDFVKTCINCLYSDYSPFGHGLFGHMMCFRNVKAEYLQVKSKDDFWKVHNHFQEFVQETHLCPEFERRLPNTGYRG